MDGEGDDTLELTGDDILDEGDDQQQQGAGDDLVIEIEGEEAGDETDLVKHLRTVARDAQREAAELRRAQQPQTIEVGKKPEMDDVGIEWDPEKYEAALLAYHDRKRQAEQAEQQRGQATQAQTQQFERARVSYFSSAAKMGIKDPEAHVQKVASELTAEHTGFIMQYTDNPAALMAALNANPGLLAKVADEPDPIRQFAMLAKMDGKVTVKRKGPPPPELQTIQRGSASLSETGDKRLAALEKEADRTNDRTKLIAYKTSLRK